MEPLDEQRESNLVVTTDAGSGMLFFSPLGAHVAVSILSHN